MVHTICKYALLISLWLVGWVGYAQQAQPMQEVVKVNKRMIALLEEIDQLEKNVSHADSTALAQIEHALSTLKIRWNILNNDAQFIIAAYDNLIDLVVQYEQNVEELNTTIDQRKQWFQAVAQLEKAEKALATQVQNYPKMEEDALKLSLLQQQAPLLEKLKLKEELLFTSLTETYNTAMQAAQQYPTLQERATALEDNYILIKSSSEKIKAAEYKPIMDRIKDYLMSFAAVAILLMFANMVQAKIQAYKQTRKSMEEYKKMLQGDNEIPTI